ncbi:MAG: phosphoribosylaminoimidazolesuccinocarboxamide synthase [Planctomycetota bacterium]
MATPNAVLETSIPGLPPPKRGKVRDVYDLGDRLLIVATDRLSAFDVVFREPIPHKGAVLTALSAFWFQKMKDVPNHLITMDVASDPRLAPHAGLLAGRSMIVRKAKVVPIECVVRGYLAGSGEKEYRKSGTVCGIPLPAGLQMGSRLPSPIFTPSTKEESGHDQNVSFEETAKRVGADLATQLRDRTLDVFSRASAHLESVGLILADTKFEWGRTPDGALILIDEVLTPDSSRFWPKTGWQVGQSPPSFDKQFVRDFLEKSGWNKEPPPPALPADVIAGTSKRYVEAYERITGKKFPPA